ncbi:MAG TPA: hypothetical protein VKV36_09700 [Acidimicrobiales bacterium]|nr:hypothetical protein [Acidimicrobiales bacterium]
MPTLILRAGSRSARRAARHRFGALAGADDTLTTGALVEKLR